MMMKIFLNTDVLLDVLMRRDGDCHIKRIIELSRRNQLVSVCVSYLSMANVAYVMRELPAGRVRYNFKQLAMVLTVLPGDDMQILSAGRIELPDYEDSLQLACAEASSCDVVITRNAGQMKDYTTIPVLTPQEFVRRCGATQ